MQVIHTIPSLIPESGGPARSVTDLCAALAKSGDAVDLLSLDVGRTFAAPIVLPSDLEATTFVPNRLAVGLRQLWAPQFKATLRRLVEQKINGEDCGAVHAYLPGITGALKLACYG